MVVLVWGICVIGLSSLLHEFGHAWAARAVGWKAVGFRFRWYGMAFVADTNGRSDQLWKVALGGLAATAGLALLFLAGTALPEPAAALFEVGFVFNAVLLFTNILPVPMLDGGKIVSGIRRQWRQGS